MGLEVERDFPRDWMWSEACEMLARADRLHRELFRPARSPARQPTWGPPVDILETDRQVLVLMALPGVDPDQVEVAIDGSDLVVAGPRGRPGDPPPAVLPGLEPPQGRFARRVSLPAGRYDGISRAFVYGCL